MRTGYAIIPAIGPDSVTWGRVTVDHDTAPRSASGLAVVAWEGVKPWLPPGSVVFSNVAELDAYKAANPAEWPVAVDP